LEELAFFRPVPLLVNIKEIDAEIQSPAWTMFRQAHTYEFDVPDLLE
jgi:hypothetical protein